MSQVLQILAALAIAIILHELAHGVVAYWLGDETAKKAGRLTLNPIRHIDKTGSIIVPVLLAVGQLLAQGYVAFMYGWAKPVPVDPTCLRLGGYRNPRRLMALVAIAGPAMNFLLAFLGGMAMHLTFVLLSTLFTSFLTYFILINLVLGLFNLIPLPPMDGGRIAVGILPLPLALWLAKSEKIGIVAVLLVLFVLPLALRQFGIQFDPFQRAMEIVLPWANHLIMALTGNAVGNN